jgi:hypothetical protein
VRWPARLYGPLAYKTRYQKAAAKNRTIDNPDDLSFNLWFSTTSKMWLFWRLCLRPSCPTGDARFSWRQGYPLRTAHRFRTSFQMILRSIQPSDRATSSAFSNARYEYLARVSWWWPRRHCNAPFERLDIVALMPASLLNHSFQQGSYWGIFGQVVVSSSRKANVLYKRVVITSESSAPPTLRTSTRVYLNHLIR